MNSLLIRYGYVALFLGVAAEGDTFLLAGAFMAHRGVFNLATVVFLSLTANTIATLIYYLMARKRGRVWLDGRFGSLKTYARASRWMEAHSDWILLLSRYAFGFRIVIPAACGALGMRPLRFNLLNLAASVIWVIPTAMFGFYFGNTAEKMFAGARRYEAWVIPVLILIAALILLYRHARRTEWLEDLRLEDLHYLAPLLTAFMGVINVASAVWPRSQGALRALGAWFPLQMAQPSRPLMLLAGVALIQVSHSLALRRRLAWYVAALTLSASLFLHLTRAFDVHHALASALLLAYLLANRGRYNEASGRKSVRMALLTTCLLASSVMMYGYIGLRHLQEQYDWRAGSSPLLETLRSGILVLEPALVAKTERARRFLTSLQVAGWLARIYLLIILLPPSLFRRSVLSRRQPRTP